MIKKKDRLKVSWYICMIYIIYISCIWCIVAFWIKIDSIWRNCFFNFLCRIFYEMKSRRKQQNSIEFYERNIYPLIVSDKEKTLKYFIRSVSACRRRSIAIGNNNKSQFYQITIVLTCFLWFSFVPKSLCVEVNWLNRVLYKI